MSRHFWRPLLCCICSRQLMQMAAQRGRGVCFSLDPLMLGSIIRVSLLTRQLHVAISRWVNGPPNANHIWLLRVAQLLIVDKHTCIHGCSRVGYRVQKNDCFQHFRAMLRPVETAHQVDRGRVLACPLQGRLPDTA